MSSALQKYSSTSLAAPGASRLERKVGRALDRLEAEVKVGCAETQAEEILAVAAVQAVQNTAYSVMSGHALLNTARSSMSNGDPALASDLYEVQRMTLTSCERVLDGLAAKLARKSFL